MFSFWRRNSVDAVHRDLVILRQEQIQLREEMRTAFATIYQAIDAMRLILDEAYAPEQPISTPTRHASNGGVSD